MNNLQLTEIVKGALNEDIGYGDLTTLSLIDKGIKARATIGAREKGVVAGLPVAARVFELLDPSLSFCPLLFDGTLVEKGDLLARVEGEAQSLLQGERVALNFLQRLSGIASKVRLLQNRIKETGAIIIDTRKTTPLLRMLEKYAVRVGGGMNHRLALDGAVLIKDNHIQLLGSIKEAIERARSQIPITTRIEVEVENLQELKEALEASPDLIMMDNMSPEEMREGVILAKGRVLLEASGRITEENLLSVAATGVHYISMGALTHSVKSMDIGLDLVIG